MLKNIFAASLIVFGMSLAFAKEVHKGPTQPASQIYEVYNALPPAPEVKLLEASEISKVTSTSSTKRLPAESGAVHSAKYNNFIKMLTQLKEDDLTALDNLLDACRDYTKTGIVDKQIKFINYTPQENDAWLFATIFGALKNFRGLYWNMNFVLTLHPDFQAMLQNSLRKNYNMLGLYGKEFQKTIFNYLNTPNVSIKLPNDPIGDIFKAITPKNPGMNVLQNYVVRVIYTQVQTLEAQISVMDLREKAIAVDLSLTFQENNLPAGMSNEFTFGVREKNLILAQNELMLAKINMFAAFNLNNIFSLIKDESGNVNLGLVGNPLKVLDFVLAIPLKGLSKINSLFAITDASRIQHAYTNYKNALRLIGDQDSVEQQYKELFDLEAPLNKISGVEIDDYKKQLWANQENILQDKPIKLVNNRNNHTVTVKLHELFNNITNEDLANMKPFFETSSKPFMDFNGKSFENVKAFLTGEPVFAIINLKHHQPKWKVDKFSKFIDGATEKDVPFILGFMASVGFPSAATAL